MCEWLAAEMGTEYTRMRSRQAFVYGAAFHLTDNERYLAWMRAGVARLRANAYEPDTGSAVSWWRDGVPGPEVGTRTAQDLAYAQLGLAYREVVEFGAPSDAPASNHHLLP